MSYDSVDSLPKGVKTSLPEHAQEIYKSAYNNALEEYENEDNVEQTAHRVAWSAVKQKYEKSNGGWYRMEHDGKDNQSS
jgi:cation transport regulator